MASTGDVTRILHELEAGDRSGFDDLLARVYEELRVLARAQLRAERADHTLAPTELAHEAYLRLVDHRKVNWANRAHFFGAAAQAMRRVLIDHARAKSTQKRKGEHVTLSSLGADEKPHTMPLETVLAIDQALRRLEMTDKRLVRVVEARFFAGLTIRETAEALGISHATVSEDWRLARAWLKRALSPDAAA
ncbi:MAG: ECF-type sigma factor [Bacteroidota bacterium]